MSTGGAESANQDTERDDSESDSQSQTGDPAANLPTSPGVRPPEYIVASRGEESVWKRDTSVLFYMVDPEMDLYFDPTKSRVISDDEYAKLQPDSASESEGGGKKKKKGSPTAAVQLRRREFSAMPRWSAFCAQFRAFGILPHMLRPSMPARSDSFATAIEDFQNRLMSMMLGPILPGVPSVPILAPPTVSATPLPAPVLQSAVSASKPTRSAKASSRSNSRSREPTVDPARAVSELLSTDSAGGGSGGESRRMKRQHRRSSSASVKSDSSGDNSHGQSDFDSTLQRDRKSRSTNYDDGMADIRCRDINREANRAEETVQILLQDVINNTDPGTYPSLVSFPRIIKACDDALDTNKFCRQLIRLALTPRSIFNMPHKPVYLTRAWRRQDTGGFMVKDNFEYSRCDLGNLTEWRTDKIFSNGFLPVNMQKLLNNNFDLRDNEILGIKTYCQFRLHGKQARPEDHFDSAFLSQKFDEDDGNYPPNDGTGGSSNLKSRNRAESAAISRTPRVAGGGSGSSVYNGIGVSSKDFQGLPIAGGLSGTPSAKKGTASDCDPTESVKSESSSLPSAERAMLQALAVSVHVRMEEPYFEQFSDIPNEVLYDSRKHTKPALLAKDLDKVMETLVPLKVLGLTEVIEFLRLYAEKHHKAYRISSPVGFLVTFGLRRRLATFIKELFGITANTSMSNVSPRQFVAALAVLVSPMTWNLFRDRALLHFHGPKESGDLSKQVDLAQTLLESLEVFVVVGTLRIGDGPGADPAPAMTSSQELFVVFVRDVLDSRGVLHTMQAYIEKMFTASSAEKELNANAGLPIDPRLWSFASHATTFIRALLTRLELARTKVETAAAVLADHYDSSGPSTTSRLHLVATDRAELPSTFPTNVMDADVYDDQDPQLLSALPIGKSGYGQPGPGFPITRPAYANRSPPTSPERDKASPSPDTRRLVPPVSARPMNVCYAHVLEGNCSRGATCSFRHIEGQEAIEFLRHRLAGRTSTVPAVHALSDETAPEDEVHEHDD